MHIPKERIAFLLRLYSTKKASRAEEEELFDWLRDNDFREPFEQHIHRLVEQFNGNEPLPAVDWDAVYQNILAQTGGIAESPVIKRRNWMRAAIAASVMLVIGTLLFYFFSSSPTQVQVAQTARPSEVIHDAAPGINGAVLTLSNGKKIVLDSASNEVLAREGNTTLLNKNGKLMYDQQTLAAGREITYNTMTTAKGRQYQLQLADGSKVWLNAASSITYPTSFSGKERSVQVSGEVYFEIAHDASRPFTVKANNTDIRVLGTHFNVNAYNDEAVAKTTLIEGSIKLATGSASILLTPGQQAQVNKKGEVNLANGIDIDEVIAWKNGLFIMKKADIGSIMRQVARWYDVDIVYQQGVPPGRISGDISRNMNLSKLLEVMELSGVRLSIEDRKVIVKP